MNDLSPAAQARIAVGFVLLPFVSAVTALVAFPVVYYTTYFDPDHHTVTIGFPLPVRIAIIVGFAAVPLTVVAAGAFVLLLHFGVRLGLLRALTAGALIGNVPYILFATLNLFVGPEAPMPVHPQVRDVVWFFEPIVFGALIGVVCAAVFWLIAGPSLDESTRP